jgi:2-C-methyl-D-erythritol 2,4-cyclodiphosphate synthase
MQSAPDFELSEPPELLETVQSAPSFRVGTGYDAHRFSQDRPLFLGGVNIPNDKGLLGHSDADVLLHALMDALLGAAALGDIGKMFPDGDPGYAGANSLGLLEKVAEFIADRGYFMVNADITVVAEKPKIAGYTGEMRANIARVLKVGIDRISVKGTTTEGMGYTGRGEGIAAQATVILAKTDHSK